MITFRTAAAILVVLTTTRTTTKTTSNFSTCQSCASAFSLPTTTTTTTTTTARTTARTTATRPVARRTSPFPLRPCRAATTAGAAVGSLSSSLVDSDGVDRSQYDLSLFSPSKINLFLRILGKRADGFHDLASLFQTISFGDMIHLKLLESGSSHQDVLECNMEGVPLDKTNLVLRAADLVRTKTQQTDKYFSINLVKRVPAQAGLGGGSGNAAAAMFGVNQLLGNPASQQELVEWSGEIGSDITFFLSQGTAYCTGRGEIMTPVDPLPPTELYIVKPDMGLSTPAVFGALNYDLLSSRDPLELLEAFQTANSMNEVAATEYLNDLEPPAFQCLPALQKLKEDLQQVEGFRHVMMSGSGTSIFCIGQPANPQLFEEDFAASREGVNVYQAKFISRPNTATWFEEP